MGSAGYGKGNRPGENIGGKGNRPGESIGGDNKGASVGGNAGRAVKLGSAAEYAIVLGNNSSGSGGGGDVTAERKGAGAGGGWGKLSGLFSGR